MLDLEGRLDQTDLVEHAPSVGCGRAAGLERPLEPRHDRRMRRIGPELEPDPGAAQPTLADLVGDHPNRPVHPARGSRAVEPDDLGDLGRGRDDSGVADVVEEQRLAAVDAQQHPGQDLQVVVDHVVAGEPGDVRRRGDVDGVEAGVCQRPADLGPALGVLLGREGLWPVDLVS